MKRIIKEKAVEIVLGLLLSSAILFTGFYYNTQSDLDYLMSDNKTIHVEIDNLDDRMDKDDLETMEIKTDMKYIIQMLQEIKDSINE